MKAHIIPAALSRPETGGAPFVQYGDGGRPTRRWSSWYDNSLVTQAGEDVLKRYDDLGIAELRKHKLIWSSWGPMAELKVPDFTRAPGDGPGIRTVTGVEPQNLRLFFLSLLWRAAASRRPEFRDITLPRTKLDQIGRMLLSGDDRPHCLYPVQLTQISSLGLIHNHTPIRMQKYIPSLGEIPSQKVPIIRFYFDGLIAHFDCRDLTQEDVDYAGNLNIGHSKELVVVTVTYEGSRQREIMLTTTQDAFANWPDVMSRLG